MYYIMLYYIMICYVILRHSILLLYSIFNTRNHNSEFPLESAYLSPRARKGGLWTAELNLACEVLRLHFSDDRI